MSIPNDVVERSRSLRLREYPTRVAKELHGMETRERDNDERVCWNAEKVKVFGGGGFDIHAAEIELPELTECG